MCLTRWLKILIILAPVTTAALILSQREHAIEHQCEGEVVSEEIKRAMMKMGPGYDYLMVGDKLYVNKGDGKWLRLRYKKGEKKDDK
mgnify:CR=1 FL=1